MSERTRGRQGRDDITYHLRYFVNTIRKKQARISLEIMKIGSDINRGDGWQVFPSLIARLSVLTPKFERLLFDR